MNKQGKICGNCQYFRDPAAMKSALVTEDGFWCSNSKSPYFMKVVGAADTCAKFSLRGEKAPLAIRGVISMTKTVRKAMGKKRDS